MRHKITLLAILFLITILAFGQKPEAKNNEIFWKSKVERQIKGLKKDDIGHRQNHLIQNNKIFSQNSNLKSSQDIKQRLDSLVDQYWDETTNQWITEGKQEFIYDANMDLTQYLLNFWNDTSSQWVGYIKYEYTYDADGYLTEEFYYNWSETNGQWFAYLKYENTYDSNGKLTKKLFSVWDENTSQWIVIAKSDYTYDANGNLMEELFYVWDENTSQWIADRKHEYFYDTNGNLTKDIAYQWDENTSQWIGDWKYEYTYDANGDLMQKLDYAWDENTIQWVANSKNEYNYDSNGNLTQDFYYVWDMTISQWITYWKYEYAYDNSYPFSDLILPHLYTIDAVSMYFNHMLTGFVSYDWDETLNEWMKDRKGTFYYSEQNITSVSEINEAELKIYPNPADDFIVFDLDNNLHIAIVEIYDFQGRKVIEEKLSADKEISVSHLNSGMYFYRLDQNEKSYTGKFIVK